ncbi:MAG: tRNA 2-thiouridine(34) synthase MnmA [Acidimicrobiales bacterium mtb01]|nr:tRNA 2-thiouridine(34) synthase MnmA [Actinomycetota bacterium]TEX47249.1 MAG: tRNA 2-thiouridine(34) synthase MnmA [Acidimicrobiales bacterium mtb01]
MKVLVAMSGGVDSSVAAALLLEQGHHVVGVTMRLWGGESDTGCCSVSDVDDARRVAQQLGIDHLVFNFTEDFHRHVVDPYVADHARGVTPNPCIECNRHLKFDRLLERAEVLGFDAVATGHHARIEKVDGVWRLLRGADAAKDQSYVIHMLDQDALSRTLLPVGTLTKAEVRTHAARLGLRTAAKPDSQDVCFITSTKSPEGATGRSSFLRRRIELHPADVVDEAGERIGSVDAVELVTLGQRRGVAGGGGSKRFVVDVDVPRRRVVVGPESRLLADQEVGSSPTWSSGPFEGRVWVQCSAHGEPRAASIRAGGVDSGSVVVAWDEPQRRVSPGQSLVFYDREGDWVIGGATTATLTTTERR